MPKIELDKLVCAGKFGEAMRNNREKAGFTQEELYKATTISVKTIANVERGNNCELLTLLEMMKALNIKCGPDCPFRVLLEYLQEISQPNEPLK